MFGDIHDPRPYKFIGFRWALISQTPVAKGRINHWFSVPPILKSTWILSMLGVPAAPTEQIDLPAGGARSAGATGIPQIDEIMIDFKIDS